MLNRVMTLAVGAAAIVLATTEAQALPTFNTGGSNSFGVDTPTTVTTSVLTTTTFGDVSSIRTDTTTGSFQNCAGCTAGQLSPTSLTLTNAPLNFGSFASFDFNDPGLGQFTATSVTLITSGTAGPNAFAVYGVVGTFTLGSDWTNSGTTISADETWSLSQTGGPGNTISISGTFHAPSVALVPEPLTISLFGAGLAGIGFGARRRKAAKKA